MPSCPEGAPVIPNSNVMQKVLKVVGAIERACFQLLQLGRETRDQGAIPNSLTRWTAAVTKALPADLIARVPVGSASNGSQ